MEAGRESAGETGQGWEGLRPGGGRSWVWAAVARTVGEARRGEEEHCVGISGNGTWRRQTIGDGTIVFLVW